MPRPTRGTGPGSSNGEPPVPRADGVERRELVDYALYSLIDEPIAIWGRDRRLLYFNRAAYDITYRITGLELSRGMEFDEVMVEPTASEFVESFDRALEGEPVDLTFEQSGLGQAAEWREYQFRPVGGDGTPEAVCITGIDLAQQRWADEQFSVIFEAAPIAMAMLDDRGRFRQVNDAFVEQMGYSREESIGRPISTLVPPETREQVAREYRQFVSGELGERVGKGFPHTRWFSRERCYLRADGERRWGDLVRVAIREQDGTLDYMLVMLLDTTKYKRSQQALEEEKSRTQAIFDAAVDGIVTIDEKGLIQRLNRAAEEIYGYSAAEIVGQSVEVLMPEPMRELHAAYLAEHGVTGMSQFVGTGGEYEALRKDGSIVPVYLSVGEMSVDHERGFVGVVRDISRQKNLEERVRRSERMEALGQLAAGIAHDFNNVLTIVNSYAHTGLDEAGQSPAAFHFHKIKSAAERGARLTRQLLTFSPAQIGETATVDLNAVVRGLEGLLRSVVEEDIDLEVETVDGVPPIVADPGQIEQVLMNLVVNARDAMPHGGTLCVSTELTHVSQPGRFNGTPAHLPQGDYVVLVVSDTGHGMDQATQKRIFEPFFTTKPEGKGTGLGLATVYGIVRRYHGDVVVDSELGKGATFRVYFPAAEEGDEGTEDEEEPSEPVRRAKATEAVLVVEDEEDIREPLRMVLEAEGYTVLEAASGEEALEVVESYPERIDLVLTDVVMPGVTGVELSKSLRDAYPSIRSVLVSGYSGEVLERKDIDAQQVRLSKPYDLEDLLDVVRDMLSS
ncbi:PAS domain S-box protein [Persicimonas caeni]|uniref:histidine kinase n=1 Tax=Persicimonas caeni TaxID=2292766 RepID=A0A4Y6Q0P2_PERCE|nr:PAS domain S-box protein [Persicimonas caeni]QDG54146.1 PAS domain S-box protein [Persicimonas caeni]QED35367.1 PAS domain S-box protein [Persicimonas caeni]